MDFQQLTIVTLLNGLLRPYVQETGERAPDDKKLLAEYRHRDGEGDARSDTAFGGNAQSDADD